MKNDEEIKKVMEELETNVHAWNKSVGWMGNQCASTDRTIERVIELGKKLDSLYNEKEENTIPTFSHINDCWNYLREAKSIDDLKQRIEQLPIWSGSWSVEEDNEIVGNEDDDQVSVLVVNSYYDEQCEDWDVEQETMYFDCNEEEK